MPTDVSALWTLVLESGPPKELGWVRRRAILGSHVPVYAAVQWPTRKLSVMLDISVAAVGALRALPATAGLSVTLQAISGLPPDQRSLVIELEDTSYADIFAVYCSDLLDGLRVCQKAPDATALVLQRLARWQEFLSTISAGLSHSEMIGLFGELAFLKDVLLPVGGIGLIGAWTGAQRAAQDFIVPTVCAIEVKTTESPLLRHVRVNGENQLDPRGLQCLYLACFRLERDRAGKTLNFLVRELRDLAPAAPEFMHVLDRKLGAAGYLDRHSNRYEQFRFRIAEQRYFEVRDSFPRVTQENLPFGIDTLTYRLNLSAAAPQECTRHELESKLRTVVLPHPTP